MASNIRSTSRAADFSSVVPAGVVPFAGVPLIWGLRSSMVGDVLHNTPHNFGLHIAADLYLADLHGQHKMYVAANGLLVGSEKGDNLFRSDHHARQRTIGMHRIFDLSRDGRLTVA